MGGVAAVHWGAGGEKGKKGKKRKIRKEGGTFRVPAELLFRTRVEAEAHLREALEEGGDKREGGDKGVGRGVTKAVREG